MTITSPAAFWFFPRKPAPPDTYEVLVDGVPRTDFDEITRVRDGADGIYFESLTHDEICSVQIHRLVNGRQR